MPNRTTVEQVPSPIQGSDAWVKLSRPKVKTIRALITKYGNIGNAQSLIENIDAAKELICACVHSWNWVDDDGNPMPQLKESPDTFEDLNTSEITWLSAQLVGEEVVEDRQKKLTI